MSSLIRAAGFRKLSGMLLFLFFLNCFNTSVAQESILEQKISIPEQRATVYEIFSKITEITGYYFIYDSKLLNSDKQVKVSSSNKTLEQLLNEVLDNNSLGFRLIERHILIFKKEDQTAIRQTVKRDSTKILNIKGQIFDKQTKQPLPFVTIGIVEENIGTVSNFDGFFALKIPPKLLSAAIKISHLGYKGQQIPIQVFSEQKVDIFLETEYVSIQEVIIRNIDPLEVVKKVYEHRFANYLDEPIYITGFYREGVQKDSKYLNYSEAIVKVYKSPITRTIESDQVKLLQSRKVINIDQKDTLIVKIKAGLRSCLALDLYKNIPDFIAPDFIDNYTYSRADIVSINSRNAYAISFEQKEGVSEALFKGTLYVDMETFAIVNTEFEVNPKFVKNTADLFVVRKSRKYRITPEKISYNINYSERDGKYYISHIREDLTISYRKRYQIFTNEFKVFLELASCQIDTLNVHRFLKEETLKTNTVFLDTKFTFDETYWGNYNIITPEEKINQALSRINAKMEFVRPD